MNLLFDNIFQIAADEEIPWDLVRKISIGADSEKDPIAQTLGFRYCHLMYFEFQTGEIARLYPMEYNDYGLTLEDITSTGSGNSLPYYELSSTEIIKSVEFIKDSDGQIACLAFCLDNGLVIQVVSGEYDNLYAEDLGRKEVKYMDEMLLVFRRRAVTIESFKTKTGTNASALIVDYPKESYCA